MLLRILGEEGKDHKKANELIAEAKYGLAQISMESGMQTCHIWQTIFSKILVQMLVNNFLTVCENFYFCYPGNMCTKFVNQVNTISLEHYETAIKDFTTCLDCYKAHLEDPLDRRIAEVHYNIGLAYSFDKKFDEAIKEFKSAVACLESRIAMLEKKIDAASENSGKEKASSELEEWNKEVNELKDLVVLDMMAKVTLLLQNVSNKLPCFTAV